ncbi:MAG: 5-dehydro-2-deoxygluconokinase [Vicinamibacterales bacterium]
MTETERFDLLCMGRSSIDLYAHEIGVPITAVRSFDAYVGGCPTNVAVGTRRLGMRSALLTAVGDDQVGEFVRHFLTEEGVETRFIPSKAGRRTSAVILTIQPPDHFPLTFYRDNCADIALTIGDVDASPVASSRFVFLSGTGLSREPSRAATSHAAARARAAGADVVVDLDYRPDQWPSAADYAHHVQALTGAAALAVGTEEEARAAGADEDTEAAVARLLDTGVPAFVLKRGARGSTICRQDGSRTDIDPFPVDVLNVLGAGDAFASGLLYGLHQGHTLEAAASIGNAVGAIVVTRHGCANFMPTLGEVRAFLEARGAPLAAGV